MGDVREVAISNILLAGKTNKNSKHLLGVFIWRSKCIWCMHLELVF